MSNTDLVPEFLVSSQRFGIKLGLGRMESLMQRLGNPQEQLACFHVAGTNGKGSVTSYMASVLASSGYRVGVYTSPYLERFSERIRILDGESSLDRFIINDAEGEISTEDLFSLSTQVQQAVETMVSAGEEHPTEFELITALAFLYFKQAGCDYVVLETGLGGRLDSTNVIKKPVAVIITAISYDHTDRLGSTIAEIAMEKAGIIKESSDVFLLSPHDTDLSFAEAETVLAVIRQVCQQRMCTLEIVSAKEAQIIKQSVEGQQFSLPFFSKVLSTGLIGHYQLQNIALVVAALQNRLESKFIVEGIAKTRWKGRLEVVSREPLMVLDGSHNPQGALSFRMTLDLLIKAEGKPKPPRLILGFMKDKDYPKILEILLTDLPFAIKEIICVTPDNPRALLAADLRTYLLEHFLSEGLFYNDTLTMYNSKDRITACADAVVACSQAVSASMLDGSPILCLGSFFLVGQVRDIFMRRQEGEQ